MKKAKLIRVISFKDNHGAPSQYLFVVKERKENILMEDGTEELKNSFIYYPVVLVNNQIQFLSPFTNFMIADTIEYEEIATCKYILVPQITEINESKNKKTEG